MYLSRVKLRHFRNLGTQELEVPPQGVAVIGANAQGKSNLLEAIYYLETFRSFRGARDDQLVAFGEDVFRVVGRLEGGCAAVSRETGDEPAAHDGIREVAAAFQRSGKKKKVTLDAREPERIGDALGRLAAVIFSPSDVAIVSEGPDGRRRFLDILLSLNVPGYLRNLQIFRQVLSQRNATLKQEGPGGVARAWDEQLIDAGARVAHERWKWIAGREPGFRRYYASVSGGREATMRYRPNLPLGDAPKLDDVRDAYRTALAESAESEWRMRTTMVGPQRDDLAISLEGDAALDVRDFGSGGQRRTAALALRLVEADTVREARGREPLVLLDDVFAELDAERSERVLELFRDDGPGQVIVTAPKESDIRIRHDSLVRWSVDGGRIESRPA